MIQKLFIQILFIGLGSFAFSQELYVSGLVKSEQNIGLPLVKVQVKGQNTGVMTDGSGFYRLKVSDSTTSVLIFSLIGYEKQEVTPLVKSLSGVIDLPKDYDNKTNYRKHILNKYSK